MEVVYGLIRYAVINAVLAIPVAAVARAKGRDFLDWYIWAFLFWLATLVVVLCIKPLKPIEPGDQVKLSGRTDFAGGVRLPKGARGTVVRTDEMAAGDRMKPVAYIDFEPNHLHQGWLSFASFVAVEAAPSTGILHRILGISSETSAAAS